MRLLHSHLTLPPVLSGWGSDGMKTFFKGRWVSQLVLAIGFFAFAAAAYTGLVQIEEGKASARAAGVPEVVSLADFQAWSDVHAADEVHVIGKTILQLNYRLEMTRKRKLSSSVEERMVYFLFGPDEGAETRTVRAALLIDSADIDRWVAEELAPGLVSSSETEVVMSLNGQKVANPDLKSMAEDAMNERGLTKAPEFFFMESWGPQGRDAALAPDPNSALMLGGGIASVGLIFLLIAGWRFSRRHKVLAQQELLARQVEGARAAMIAKYKAQGLAVPDALTMPLKPRKSRAKPVMVVLLGLVVASVVLAKLGILDDALFAIPLLVVLLVILGVRSVFKVVTGGVVRLGGAVAQAVVPERPEPPPAPRYGPNFKPLGMSAPVPDSPLRVSDNNLPEGPVIRSVPSPLGRLSSALSAPELIKWAPLAIGVIVMFASAKLFDGLGLSGQMGAADVNPVQSVQSLPQAPEAVPAAAAVGSLPQLPDFASMSVEGMVLSTLALVLLMAVLGFGLNMLVSRYAARRNIAYPNDPWARLERMTAAERARG